MVVIHIIDEKIYASVNGENMVQIATSQLVELLAKALPKWIHQVPMEDFNRLTGKGSETTQ